MAATTTTFTDFDAAIAAAPAIAARRGWKSWLVKDGETAGTYEVRPAGKPRRRCEVCGSPHTVPMDDGDPSWEYTGPRCRRHDLP